METFDVFEATRAKELWKVSVLPDRLVFESEGVARAITREERGKVELDPLLLIGQLVVHLERKVTFAPNTELKNALFDWFGPPTRDDLRATLRHRHNTVSLITSVALIVVSTPWFVPAWLHPTEPGVEPFGFSWLLLAWGVGSLVLWLLSRVVIHRAMFILEGLFATTIGAWWVVQIARGETHIAWAGLLLFLVIGLHHDYRYFRRYARV